MGLILDTDSEILGIEIRRESVSLVDLKRSGTGVQTSDHIFVYGDGAIEVSKEWLKELLGFFAKPENAQYLK
jgi:hypothetical protein